MRRTVPAPTRTVAAVFDGYPATVRGQLLRIRELVLLTAQATPGVGPIEETLKWGEPAYLTAASGSGSTIRLGWSAKTPDKFGIYFNCQTTLVDEFRSWFPKTLTFEGNRAVMFELHADIPVSEITICIETALTYHLRKRRKSVAP